MDYTAGCHTHFPMRLHFDFTPIWSRPEWPAKWISPPTPRLMAAATGHVTCATTSDMNSVPVLGDTVLERTRLMLLLHIKHIRTFETKGVNIKLLHLNTSGNFTQLQITTGWRNTSANTPGWRHRKKRKKSPTTSESYLSLHKIKEITLLPPGWLDNISHAILKLVRKLSSL